MDILKSELIRIQEWRLSKNELAYGSTLLISIAPFLVLFLFKVDNSSKHRNKLRLALSFASGGLLGDAFLHLIPHSMGHHDHNHEEQHQHQHNHHDHTEHSHGHEEEHNHHHHHEQTFVGLYIIAGIILFFIIEKFIHIVKGESHHHGHHHHQHQHSKRKEKKSDSEETSDDESLNQQNVKNRKTPKSLKKSKSYSKQRNSDLQQKTRLVSGILNLIADFLHNFTDGLAIGATFAAGKGMGSITAVTILLHEIPHEIGDYAILIQAGYKRRNALLLQLVTAIGALIGTAVGLHYGTLEHATQFILPVTAGGFIYIATVTVIPELLEKANNHLQSLLEIISMFAGVAMLYWIALNE